MKKDVLDLSKGSPRFMAKYWTDLDSNLGSDKLSTENSSVYKKMDFIRSEFAMDYVFGGTESLKASIERLHKTVKNANISGKNIVVGNGSTQVILASLYALCEKYKNDSLYTKRPYYFRFPEFAKLSKLPFLDDSSKIKLFLSKKPIELITSPNNPDNDFNFPQVNKAKQKIFDFTYQWPQYTDVLYEIDEDIMIFSMSKSTGHAASRVGWGLVKDSEIARLMEEYIENTTVGISAESQKRCELILNLQADLIDKKNGQDCFSFGKKELKGRWEIFLELPKDCQFKVLNPLKNGMFAWCKIENHPNASNFMMDKYLISCKKGSSLGMTDEYFRINIGCDDWTFNELCNRIKQ
jgi:L-tryptophan--pyruvate aminotransferase